MESGRSLGSSCGQSSPLTTPGNTPSPPPEMVIYSTSSMNSQPTANPAQSDSHGAWLTSVQDEAHRAISPLSPNETFIALSHDPRTDVVTKSPLGTPPTSPSGGIPNPPTSNLQTPGDLLPAFEETTTTQLAETEVSEAGSTLAINEKMLDACDAEGGEVRDGAVAQPTLTADSVMAEPAVHAAEANLQLQSEAEKEVLVDAADDLATDSERQATPPPLPAPTLIELILQTVEKNKKSVKRGDVAILVSLKDLRSTLFASSRKLFAASEVLEKAAQRPRGVRAEDPIQYVFLLEVQGDAGAMAILTPLDGSRSLESLSGTDCRPYFDEHDPVKAEPGEPLSVAQPLDFKAFTTFLALAAGQAADTKGLFMKDPAKELLHLEAVITIATPLQAEATIANAFPRLALVWMNNNLNTAIATEAASWLQIGFVLQQRNIYNEAFRQVAGCFPDWPWATKQHELPDVVFEAVKKCSTKLRDFRYHIDLSLTILSVQKDRRYVASRKDPNEYHAGHVFQDWIALHLLLLQQSEAGLTTANGAVHPATSPALCGHHGACLDVAGFYRTISKGGDAYLPADLLVSENGLLSNATLQLPSGWDEAKVRKRLNELKDEAAQLVTPLVKSSSMFKENQVLKYLTCVEPSQVVPWDDGEVAEEMDLDGV